MTSALFDEGSTVTLVDTRLAKILQASGPVKPPSLTWTDKKHQHHPQFMSLNLQITRLQGDTFQLRMARTVDKVRFVVSAGDVCKGAEAIAAFEKRVGPHTR